MANDERGGNTSGGSHDYDGVKGNVLSGSGTMNNYYGSAPGVGSAATRSVAQHQPEGGRPPVGRAAELQALQAALDDHPCVAIVGVGGMGKSTIADMHAHAANYTARCWRNLHHNPDFADFVQAALASFGIAFKPAEMPQPAEQANHLIGILRDRADACDCGADCRYCHAG